MGFQGFFKSADRLLAWGVCAPMPLRRRVGVSASQAGGRTTMAVIRRHWKAALLSLLTVLVVAGWIVVMSHSAQPVRATEGAPGASPSGGQEQPKGLDPLTYSRVRQLRQRLALDNETLAAMGCGQETAGNALAALKAWYEANKAAWETAEKAKAKATRDLREAFRKVHVGPRDESLLRRVPALQNALAEAERAERQVVEGAVPAVEAQLADAQRAFWRSVRADAGPGRYRYAFGLPAEKRQQLERTEVIRGRRLAAARSPAESAAAETAYRQAMDGILTGTQRLSMMAAQESVQRCMAGVLKGEKEALPPPPPPERPKEPTQ